MPVRALDCAVLVRLPRIVARRRHPVMGAQPLVAAGHILLCIAVEIAEGGRQAVTAMLQGRPAERPQGILQHSPNSVGVTATMYNRVVFFPGSIGTRKATSVSRGRAAAALIRSGRDAGARSIFLLSDERTTDVSGSVPPILGADVVAVGRRYVYGLRRRRGARRGAAVRNPRRRDPHLRVIIARLHRLPRA